MAEAVNRFYNSIENGANESQAALIELFVYFLTVELGKPSATPKLVNECFQSCDLVAPAGTAARLSDGLKTKPPKYIKSDGGYKLYRHNREQISKKLGAEITVTQTSAVLRGLESNLSEGPSKDFLSETINCFEVGANRATVLMAWIHTIDHLYSHILKHKLHEFNEVLAKNTNKRVKIKNVVERDDFNEIHEGNFLELCRTANIISKDVRKILDQKLGTRNSCAHPSGVVIGNAKVVDFVEDLMVNVVMKYPT